MRSIAIGKHPKRRDKTIAAFATNPIIIAKTGRLGGGLVCRRGGREIKAERKLLLAISFYYLSMIFSENRYPLFGIIL